MTADDTSTNLKIDENYTTYRQRWGILACVVSLNMVAYMNVITFGPIAHLAAKYFGVSGDSIDLFSLIPMIANIPSMVIAIFIVDRHGIQLSIRIGATLVTIGALIKFFATFPAYEKNVEQNTKFWLTLSGQIIVGCGHPFIITLSTKISQSWFSLRERIWTTSIIALSSALGAAIGSALSPLIVGEKVENVPYVNIYFPILSFVGFILAWFVVTRPLPLTPPSASAEMLMKKDFVTMRIFLTSLKKVLTNKTGVAMILLMGGGVGTFNTITTQLGQFMCATGYSSGDAGLSAALMIVCGILGVGVIGPPSRRLKMQEYFAKGAFSFGCLGLLGACLCLRETNLLPGIIVCLVCYGFAGLGAFPLVLELAAEETFPTDPVFTEAFIHIMGQVSSIFLIVVGNALHWESTDKIIEVQTCTRVLMWDESTGVVPWDYTPFYYLIMAVAAVSSVCFLCFINPTLRRTECDEKINNDDKK